jgi:hypothetical protein
MSFYRFGRVSADVLVIPDTLADPLRRPVRWSPDRQGSLLRCGADRDRGWAPAGRRHRDGYPAAAGNLATTVFAAGGRPGSAAEFTAGFRPALAAAAALSLLGALTAASPAPGRGAGTDLS